MAAPQFNNIPTYRVALVVQGDTQKDWYRFFSGLFRGLAPASTVPVALGASPYTYTMPVKGFLIVTGGTVSAVEFSRDGTTFINYGTTFGQFTANAADLIRITYTVAPTVNLIPT